MIDITLYLKNLKDKMSAEELARHERVAARVRQFAEEYGVSSLALALAMQYIMDRSIEGEERDKLTQELAKEIDLLLPYADMDQIKLLMLERMEGLKNKEAKNK